MSTDIITLWRPIMAKKKEPIAHSSTVAGVVSDAMSELENLCGELQDWYDNLPENFQNGQKGDELQEAIGTLESLSEPDVPSSVADLPVEWSSIPSSSSSRRQRRDDALEGVYAVISVLDDRISELETSIEAINVEGGVPDEEREKCEQLESEKDEAETCRDEMQAFIDEAEGVEFPGMR